MPFASLGLSPALVDAAAASGFTAPTPVQAAAIPVVLKGQDLLACAQTGSGKTAAFALPLLQMLQTEAQQRNTQVLILVPTRELASQVGEVITLLAQRLAHPIKVAVVYGGALAHSLLREPVRVDIAPTEQTQPDIAQRVIAVDAPRRTQLLKHLVEQHQWSRVLVFVATQYAAEHIAEKLYKAGIYASPFHGGLSQGARTQVLQEFKDERWQVVVTTDLAARGIDIAQLPAVVNYDLPRSTDDYTHRIGRTGRAGESGVAVSFVTAESEAHFRLIEKRQNLSLPRETVAGFEPTEPPVQDRGEGNGGIKGKRPSKKDKLRAAAALAAGTS
eukprot:gene6964-6813_t